MREINLVAYTDSAAYNNGKKIPSLPEHSSSVGIILYGDSIILGKSKFNPNTDNSYGELYAIYLILKKIYKLANQTDSHINLILYSDSAYVVQSINDWIPHWKCKNWRNSTGKEVAHKHLFEQIDSLLSSECLDVIIYHISGHINMNKPKDIEKALKRFKRFNGFEISVDELEFHVTCNDICDRYAKEKLRLNI